MTAYPIVRDEWESLRLVLDGRSLARYGDGEFNLAMNAHGIKCQVAHPKLSQRLREILHDSGECVVGIPNIHSATPKAEFWNKYLACAPMLTDRLYASAFVTRPDSAPWLDTASYWRSVESLWVGQDVTLVRGSSRSLTSADLVGATSVTEVIGPREHAFAQYDALMEQIGAPQRVLLCLGPTATVMAVDLCAKGVHAIDIGHVGMFLKKHRQGQPMAVTAEDKAA